MPDNAPLFIEACCTEKGERLPIRLRHSDLGGVGAQRVEKTCFCPFCGREHLFVLEVDEETAAALLGMPTQAATSGFVERLSTGGLTSVSPSLLENSITIGPATSARSTVEARQGLEAAKRRTDRRTADNRCRRGARLVQDERGLDEAVRLLESSVKIYDEHGRHRDAAYARGFLVRAYLLTGCLDEAEREAREALGHLDRMDVDLRDHLEDALATVERERLDAIESVVASETPYDEVSASVQARAR